MINDDETQYLHAATVLQNNIIALMKWNGKE
jgi:hypothetical protein